MNPSSSTATTILAPRTLATATLVFCWLALTAWARPLLLPDEGRYVGVAWEMLRSGDWLTPTLDGLPYFHKPPLFYWITAAAMSLFGPQEWAARMAPMLGGSLGALSIFVFTRRWAGPAMARACLLALLVQPLFLLGGQFANLDMLVAGCITSTITLFAHAALSAEQGRPDRRALLGAYAMAAAGVLAKGLIGIVIPLLVLGAWLLWRRSGRGLADLWSMPGTALFLTIAAPWFVAMQCRFPDFLHYFIVEQHFKRFAAGGFNNVQPFWFYPAVLGLFYLPWLPWLLRSLRHKTSTGTASIRSLMLLWVAAVMLFFSLPQSKLLGYVLPAVAPMSYLVADGFVRHAPASTRGRRAWLGIAVLALLLSLATVAWLARHHDKSTRELSRVLAAERQAGEPVFMLHSYYFDMPYYAGLQPPAVVVDNWSSAELRQRDSWRKELLDAGQFAPQQAARQLIEPRQLAPSLCAAPVSWVVGPSDSSERFTFLGNAQAMAAKNKVTLWRVDLKSAGLLKALGCAERPSAGRAST